MKFDDYISANKELLNAIPVYIFFSDKDEFIFMNSYAKEALHIKGDEYKDSVLFTTVENNKIIRQHTKNLYTGSKEKAIYFTINDSLNRLNYSMNMTLVHFDDLDSVRIISRVNNPFEHENAQLSQYLINMLKGENYAPILEYLYAAANINVTLSSIARVTGIKSNSIKQTISRLAEKFDIPVYFSDNEKIEALKDVANKINWDQIEYNREKDKNKTV